MVTGHEKRDVYRRADPDDPAGKFVRVDVAPIGPLPSEMPLSVIKADGRLDDLALVRQSRLSVMPVSDEHWAIIDELAKREG